MGGCCTGGLTRRQGPKSGLCSSLRTQSTWRWPPHTNLSCQVPRAQSLGGGVPGGHGPLHLWPELEHSFIMFKDKGFTSPSWSSQPGLSQELILSLMLLMTSSYPHSTQTRSLSLTRTHMGAMKHLHPSHPFSHSSFLGSPASSHTGLLAVPQINQT